MNNSEFQGNVVVLANQESQQSNPKEATPADEDEEEMSCPFRAKVVENYTPSPYEHSHIALKRGQMVTVLEMRSMGKWFGELNESGKKGLFPFNRVEIIKD